MKHTLKIFLLFWVFLGGCTTEYQTIDRSETAVIVDSVFQAEKIGELDVLVVVDRSGSMNDDADEVGSGIELFRLDIEGLTTDYRFAFITTDSGTIGYAGYYDSSSSSIELAMAASILPPAADEAGFESTYVFLNNDDGIDFRRPDADFLLFLISDEDEQSSISTSIFYDWLQEEFALVKHDVVAITTTDECAYTYGIGYKYIELVNLYGKDAIPICGENWEYWLSESSFLTQMISSISLSQTPIVESITVYVNHESIYGWSYSEDANMVTLDSVPDYGSLIEVGYKVAIE
ncbi:hypothetical protein CL634_07800 [bacterium]|nr:hypothetical protein [bacterium]